MERRTLILTLIATCLTANLFSQVARWQQPNVVSIGRELPRTEIVSYSSPEEALIQSRESSLYLQPLDQQWEKSTQDNAVAYSQPYKVPFAWVDRQVILHVGAVETAYDIFVNDHHVGYNQSGMSPAEFDITSMSKEGNNVLKIIAYPTAISRKIENRQGVAPTGKGSHIGQIEGEVYIVAQPRVRIRDYVASARMEGKEGRIELGVAVKSHLLNPKDVRMYYQLYSPTGALVTEGRRDIHIDMRKEDTVRFYIAIPDALAWNHETPNLYTMLLKTQHEGRFTEFISFKVGLREVEMKHGQLVINSREVPLRVAEYSAPSDTKTMLQELQQLKSQGTNCIKVSGGPQSREFYETCDILGLYVCNQADINAHLSGDSLKPGGTPTNNPLWRDTYVDRVLTMYHSSKNHPSVVMFSLGNKSANGYNLYESYLRIKELEPSRPIIYLDARGQWNSDAVSDTAPQSDIQRWGKGLNAEQRMVFGTKTSTQINTPEELIAISAIDATKGLFSIQNNYLMAPLRNAEVVYTVRSGRRVVSEGRLPIEVIAGSSGEVTIPRGKAKAGEQVKIELVVERNAQQSYNYAPTKSEGEVKQTFIERVQDNLNLKVTEKPAVKVTVAKREFTTTF